MAHPPRILAVVYPSVSAAVNRRGGNRPRPLQTCALSWHAVDRDPCAGGGDLSNTHLIIERQCRSTSQELALTKTREGFGVSEARTLSTQMPAISRRLAAGRGAPMQVKNILDRSSN